MVTPNFSGAKVAGYRANNRGRSLAMRDPDDRGMMDIVGFDTAAPAVIADFVRS